MSNRDNPVVVVDPISGETIDLRSTMAEGGLEALRAAAMATGDHELVITIDALLDDAVAYKYAGRSDYARWLYSIDEAVEIEDHQGEVVWLADLPSM